MGGLMTFAEQLDRVFWPSGNGPWAPFRVTRRRIKEIQAWTDFGGILHQAVEILVHRR